MLQPDKLRTAKALLLRSSVYLHVDPQRDTFECQLPPRFKLSRHTVLQVGLDMPVPIPDLRVLSHGVGGTLSFGGHPFYCWIPWDCVIAMVGEEGKGWIWDRTPELEAILTASKQTAKVVSLADFRAKKAARV